MSEHAVSTLTSTAAQEFADTRDAMVYVCLCPRFEDGMQPLIIFGHELHSSDIVLRVYAPNGAV